MKIQYNPKPDIMFIIEKLEELEHRISELELFHITVEQQMKDKKE